MLDGILSIVNKFIPDEDKAKELEAKLQAKHVEAIKQVKLEQANIIKQEVSSGAGKWRPRLMYMCMFMIGTHYLLGTILPFGLELYGINEDPVLGSVVPQIKPLSKDVWSFIKMGIGGYIGSRGLEKIVEKGIKEWRK